MKPQQKHSGWCFGSTSISIDFARFLKLASLCLVVFVLVRVGWILKVSEVGRIDGESSKRTKTAKSMHAIDRPRTHAGVFDALTLRPEQEEKAESASESEVESPPTWVLAALEEREHRVSRPADEWQGMRPDTREIWPCGTESGEQKPCSMARACVDGRCVPCRSDDQCEANERCVLDHCVREDQVECRSKYDCEGEEVWCVLSGYSTGDLRGNREMRAYCLEPNGPAEEDPSTTESDLEEVPIPKISEQELQEEQSKAARYKEVMAHLRKSIAEGL